MAHSCLLEESYRTKFSLCFCMLGVRLLSEVRWDRSLQLQMASIAIDDGFLFFFFSLCS